MMAALGIEASYRVARKARPEGNAKKLLTVNC